MLFFGILFFIKKFIFYQFYLFFVSVKFPQKNINQWETEIGDRKLSVKLYASNSLRNSPRHSAIAETFAEGNLYFL